MTIPWTKCSERMPPRTYKEKVILRGHPDKYLMHMTAEDCNLLLPNYSKLREYCEWTPYTPEAWAESTNPDKVWLDELPELLKQQAD